MKHFNIGNERLPRPLLRALGIVKRCAALANIKQNALDKTLSMAIADAALKVIDGTMDAHFPLVIWKTGSGTQSNMNANEVISNLRSTPWAAPWGPKRPCTPTTTAT